MPDHARLRLRLLGRFSASIERTPPQLAQISAPRHRVLLGYLALQPGLEETRERLATLLWSERPDKQARQSLRQLLLTLRQELQGAGVDPLRVERDRVALDPALVTVDARELLALAQSEAEADVARAVDVEYGVLLDGVSFDSEAVEEWLRNERARFEAVAAQLFRRSAGLHDAAGRGAPAIRAAERLVALDPLREDAHRLLLRLLARHRGREAALAHAQRLAATLREELGAAPAPDTAKLIAEIERQETRVADPAPPEPATVAEAMPAPRPQVQPSRRFPRAAAGLAIAASVAVVAVLALEAVREPATSVASNAPRPAPAAPPPDWHAPSILAGVSADTRALAAQGVFPVLVLPFTAAADQGDEKVLAERISDDLTNELSRVPALRVIARATARVYAGRAVDVAAIGSELGVRYVVEGSLQLSEGRLRINAALIDVATRLQVWSNRFEHAAEERSALRDEMVRSIARHLHVTVFAADERRRGPPRAGDPAIEELLAKGWNGIINIFELGATSGADAYFEEVLRRQPANGSATLGLAGYKIGVVGQFLVPQREPYLGDADALVTRVLTVNPRSHMGQYYRGLLHKMRGQPQEALAQFTRVLEMNPSFAPAYANSGHVMSRAGRLDEAMEHIRYAMRLSPKDPSFGLWSLYAGETELERGRDVAALEWLKRAVQLHPRSPFNHAALAAALALGGDAEAAAREAAATAAIAPWLTLNVMLERLQSTADPAHPPRRLIEGLRKAFAGTTG